MPLLKTLLIYKICFWYPCWKSGNSIYFLEFISGSSLIFHWSTRLFRCSTMPSVSLWFWSTIWGQLFWFLHHFSPWLGFILAIESVLYFHMNFQIAPPWFYEHAIEIHQWHVWKNWRGIWGWTEPRHSKLCKLHKNALTGILWNFYLDSSEYRVQSRDRKTQNFLSLSPDVLRRQKVSWPNGDCLHNFLECSKLHL